MTHRFTGIVILGMSALLAGSAMGASIYNNLTPTNQIAIASRPGTAGGFEIEAADDFLLSGQTLITGASFVGLVVPGTAGTPSISQIVVEVYRVFPADSDPNRIPNVPTRNNSPSDVALVSRDSAGSELSFGTTVLAGSFTALNSVEPGGIHASPLQRTGGNGSVTGEEVQFDVTFTTPISLAADHYFFIPQVQISNGGQFYWLSASRPISGGGTTPIAPDLQAWTRDAALDPDWLRVGTDIVGGATPPTFNAAFSLDGSTAAPEPSSVLLVLGGAMLVMVRKRRAAR